MKPTYTKSWARNLLMLDLIFGPSFKVKRWFTGFVDLSFRWIQICIGSLIRRSSYSLGHINFAVQNNFFFSCESILKFNHEFLEDLFPPTAVSI